MSTSKVLSSEHEHEISNGTLESLPQEFALALPRDSPLSSQPNREEPSPSTTQQGEDTDRSEAQRSLAPSASAITKSTAPSRPHSQSRERSSVSSPGTPRSGSLGDCDQDVRDIILRSFAPRVAVYSSTDTEKFIRAKGFQSGLCGLLRPYGERLQGRIIIRDSIGSSKAWDDFAIRFFDSQDSNRPHAHRSDQYTLNPNSEVTVNGYQEISQGRDARTATDQVLEHFLRTDDGDLHGHQRAYPDHASKKHESTPESSPLYYIYLRKLLSSACLVPYETFSHPVACMIAVSAHNPAPIETLRQLYANTGRGNNQFPAFVGKEYLRYYVLIHDEEKDDITKSTALYDLMKRHFGLHCHLLRLKGSQCVQTDDDSTKVPQCEWLSAEEELYQIRARDYTEDDSNITENFILESDATAIRALLREMVTQSLVPFMESRVMTWNDQVASRRRGISGRFMSLSKRWTGLGSSKNGSSAAPSSSGTNYDHQFGFYPPETPEATMRQLADYALMLRDWKLAYTTYDLLRPDFSHDKAWAYYAAVNEMAAITSLLAPQTSNLKSRVEIIDQMLDTAAYSYLTRCSMPANAVRCLTLATDLYKTRGPVAVDDVARWGGRLLELGILTSFAQAIMTERFADSYASRTTSTVLSTGTRRRQAALWNVLASESWMRLGKLAQARSRFQYASEMYEFMDQPTNGPSFASLQPLWQSLTAALRRPTSSALVDLDPEDRLESKLDQESEQLNVAANLSYMESVDTEGFTQQDAGRWNSSNLKGHIAIEQYMSN